MITDRRKYHRMRQAHRYHQPRHGSCSDYHRPEVEAMPYTCPRLCYVNEALNMENMNVDMIAYLVKNESAGIQFDPPQKIRMLLISNKKVKPS